MRLAIPRETHPGEDRASVTPETVKKLVRLGADVVIESGAGKGAGHSDDAFKEAGATITGFARLEVGEGIEVEKEDFAAEVAKTMGG